MLRTGRPEQQTIEDGVVADAKPACVALVPMVTPAQWSQIPRHQLTRSNSTFVTHLIATAEQVPQARNLRRATLADAQSAYSAIQHRVQGAGIRARQIV
jgi:hypothetical protein